MRGPTERCAIVMVTANGQGGAALHEQPRDLGLTKPRGLMQRCAAVQATRRDVGPRIQQQLDRLALAAPGQIGHEPRFFWCV